MVAGRKLMNGVSEKKELNFFWEWNNCLLIN